MKQSEEYKKIEEYVEDALHMQNHPKLLKLAELLTIFFTDPKHKHNSKAIVFT